jgi:hypothetical protein
MQIGNSELIITMHQLIADDSTFNAICNQLMNYYHDIFHDIRFVQKGMELDNDIKSLPCLDNHALERYSRTMRKVDSNLFWFFFAWKLIPFFSNFAKQNGPKFTNNASSIFQMEESIPSNEIYINSYNT